MHSAGGLGGEEVARRDRRVPSTGVVPSWRVHTSTHEPSAPASAAASPAPVMVSTPSWATLPAGRGPPLAEQRDDFRADESGSADNDDLHALSSCWSSGRAPPATRGRGPVPACRPPAHSCRKWEPGWGKCCKPAGTKSDSGVTIVAEPRGAHCGRRPLRHSAMRPSPRAAPVSCTERATTVVRAGVARVKATLTAEGDEICPRSQPAPGSCLPRGVLCWRWT